MYYSQLPCDPVRLAHKHPPQHPHLQHPQLMLACLVAIRYGGDAIDWTTEKSGFVSWLMPVSYYSAQLPEDFDVYAVSSSPTTE